MNPVFTFNSKQNKVVAEPTRQTPIVEETDILICGGGPAGISAALAAASSGAKTVLLEANGCLGGVWTAGLLSYILDPKLDDPLTALLISELESRGGMNAFADMSAFAQLCKDSFFYNPEVMKLVLEQLFIRFGIKFQLHTRVCAVTHDVDKRKIESVITESKSGRQAWKAKIFIDATGDGDLSALAGCTYSVGRPDSAEVQPMTLMCVLATPHHEKLIPYSLGKCDFKAIIKSLGLHTSYGDPILIPVNKGLFAFMMNHHYASAFDAAEMTCATVEARAEIFHVVEQLRKNGGIWDSLYVAATAEQIGIREGRRIKGRYEVMVDDLVTGKVHKDAICKATFPVDVHSTKKHSNIPYDEDRHHYNVLPYDIPLRALIAADIDNLLMAGRCISGDFSAHASYRVTGNSVPMGEAAGFLASLSVADKVEPSQSEWSRFREFAETSEQHLFKRK